MLFQRQAGRHVILHHVLAERHGGQRDGLFREKLVAQDAAPAAAALPRLLAVAGRRGGADADHVEPARRPQRGAPVEPQRAERIGLRQPLDGEARNAGDGREPLDRGKTVAAGRDEFFQFLFAKPVDEAEAEADRVPASVSSPACGAGRELSSVQSQSLKLTSAARISTPCARASRTSCAG